MQSSYADSLAEHGQASQGTQAGIQEASRGMMLAVKVVRVEDKAGGNTVSDYEHEDSSNERRRVGPTHLIGMMTMIKL